MRTSHAFTVAILALLIGYAAGYFTYLVRFPTPEHRAALNPASTPAKLPVFVHPILAEVEKARKLHTAGKATEAQTLLREQLRLHPQAPDARAARELLGAINTELFFSRDELYGKTEYVVQRGDSLGRIARKLKSSPEMIMRANDLDSTLIRVGERLVVPDGDFTLTIDLERERVVVHHGDGFFKQYPIQSIDVPRSSQSRVSTKVTATTFWKEGKRVLPSVQNLADATAWVLLDRPGYILYGVSEEGGVEPETVEIREQEQPPADDATPTPASNPDIPPRGIALLKDDLAELQLLLSRGTPVTILRERR